MHLKGRNVLLRGFVLLILVSSAVIFFSLGFKPPHPYFKDVTTKIYSEIQTKPVARETVSPGRCLPVANATANYSVTGWYFHLRNVQLNQFNYAFIERSRQMCSTNEEPFLVIVSLTVYNHFVTRKVIRQTWGSVARTRKWPEIAEYIDGVKLFFIYGVSEGKQISEDTKRRMDDEIKEYGDIVTARFNDNYQNLTIKVAMALRWVQQYCPRARYVLKVDEDVFMHIPNLINYLKGFTAPGGGQIHGTALTSPIVNRRGKWKVSKDVYPFYRYPIYTSGCAYVISGNIVDGLLTAAEHMPFVSSEDAFFTGILRTAIGAQLCHGDGFTYRSQHRPKFCSFHNKVRLAATDTDDDLKMILWSVLHTPQRDCFRLSHRYLPRVQLAKWLIG